MADTTTTEVIATPPPTPAPPADEVRAVPFAGVPKDQLALTKNQDLADAFRDDVHHSVFLLYVENIDCLTLYNPTSGIYPIDETSRRWFRKYIYEYIKNNAKKNLTMSMVEDIIEQIKITALYALPDTKTRYLALHDCYLNTDTFTLEPLGFTSPRDRACFYSLDTISRTMFETQPHPSPTKWLAFLSEVLIAPAATAPDAVSMYVSDPSAILLMQEIFGYCLLPSTRAEATFFLVGDGANGKSVLLNILAAVIGEQNCSSFSIEALTTDKFSVAALIDKRLNICTEEESHYLKSDKFKSLVSGEFQQVQEKYGKLRRVKLDTKFIFATNEMPTFTGFNHGLIRRCHIIPFNYRIPKDKRDVNLAQTIIREELPQIILWALAGAWRLQQSGFTFTESRLLQNTSHLFEEQLSGAAAFIYQQCVNDDQAFMSYDDLFHDYTLWCEVEKRKTQNFANFKKDVKRIDKFGPASQWDADKGHAVRGRHFRRKRPEEIED